MAFDRFKTNIKYEKTQEKATTTELELYERDFESLNYSKSNRDHEYLKMWLLSRKHDYIRDPERGLALRDTIFRKTMNQQGINEMKRYTADKCASQLPDFVLEDSVFVPNEANRSWEVLIKGYTKKKEAQVVVPLDIDVSNEGDKKEWQE